MIVSCSFSIFAIDFESAKDRMSVSVIILLTCTAFQSLIASQLPQSSALMLIDYYICTALFIQILLIMSTLLLSALVQMDIDIDTIYLFDNVIGVTLGAVWIMASMFYLSLNNKTMCRLYEKCTCCCHKNFTFTDWNIRAKADDEWLGGPNFRDVGCSRIVKEVINMKGDNMKGKEDMSLPPAYL